MGKLAILERARLMGKLEHNTKHPGLGCILSYFSQFALTQLRLHTGLVLLVGPSSMMQSCKHLRSSLVQFFCGIVCGTKLRQIVFFSHLSLSFRTQSQTGKTVAKVQTQGKNLSICTIIIP